jgi:hypothetical protein
MADIPAGGYQQADVPDPAVWDLITRFDQNYSAMLQSLEAAWTHGDPSALQLGQSGLGSHASLSNTLSGNSAIAFGCHWVRSRFPYIAWPSRNT